MGWRELVAVLLGGALGTGLRLGLDILLPHDAAAFPTATLIINTLGAFVLAVLVGRVWSSAPSWARAGLGAGLLGSFTTFSALAVSLVWLSAAGEWMLAAAYLAATLLLALAAAGLGLCLATPRPPKIDLVDE